MASLQTLERRIAALEARLADVEGGYGDTLYKLHPSAVQTRLDLRKVLAQMNIEPTSDEEISVALDEE